MPITNDFTAPYSVRLPHAGGPRTQIDVAAVIEHAKANSVADVQTGCWVWQKACANGYAYRWYNNKAQRVARLVLGLSVGDADQALHSCDNSRCVNPMHLRRGDQTENIRDAVIRKRHSESRKTHCPAGHHLTELQLRGGKYRRRCLTCHRESSRRRKAAIRSRGVCAE